MTPVPAAVLGGGVLASYAKVALASRTTFAITPVDAAAVVFDASSATEPDSDRRRELSAAGKVVVALVPDRGLPPVVPAIRAASPVHRAVTIVSSGVQGAAPIVDAIAGDADVSYAECITTMASRTIGRWGRQDISELTSVTGDVLRDVCGLVRGKACVLIGSGSPPGDTTLAINCFVSGDLDDQRIRRAVELRVGDLQKWLPGYRMTSMVSEQGCVKVRVTIRGSAPAARHTGNLELISTAAFRVAEASDG